jgi:hypothetical protein
MAGLDGPEQMDGRNVLTDGWIRGKDDSIIVQIRGLSQVGGQGSVSR